MPSKTKFARESPVRGCSQALLYNEVSPHFEARGYLTAGRRSPQGSKRRAPPPNGRTSAAQRGFAPWPVAHTVLKGQSSEQGTRFYQLTVRYEESGQVTGAPHPVGELSLAPPGQEENSAERPTR